MKASDFFDDPPPQRETATTTPLAPTAGAVAATSGPCRRLLHPRPGIDGRTQNSCPRRLGDHLHNLEPSRSSTCEKQGGTQTCRRMTTSLTENLTRRHSRLWTSRNSRSRSPRPLHSATQTYGPPPILKCQTRSCVAHFYSTGSRCWCGSGGNGAGREPTAWKEEKTEGQDENYEEANCGEAGPLRRP